MSNGIFICNGELKVDIKKNDKRTLIAIGGNEDKREALKVLTKIINEGKGSETNIKIITTASIKPQIAGGIYKKVFEKIGVKQCEVINIDTREQANNFELIQHVREADTIFFSGGDQLRLTSILGGTSFLEEVKKCYTQGTIIAGTSAGATILSDTTIFDGKSKTALLKGHVFMGSGFGFIKYVIFDTHFIGRGRISRLFQVLATNPENIGVGLGEDTGVLIRNNDIIEVFGNGSVIIVDGSQLKNSNIAQIKQGKPFSVENFIVHILISGYQYDLKTKKLLNYEREKDAFEHN